MPDKFRSQNVGHKCPTYCFGNGQNAGGAGVADNDAVALVAVGQPYGVAGDGNEFAVENRLGRELGFGEVHSIYSGYLKTKFRRSRS